MPTEFWRLYKRTQIQWHNCDDLCEMDPHLFALLGYIKDHPENETYFKDCFIFLMTRSEGFECEVIEFCMRELRWPEIRVAAQELVSHFEDWRKKQMLLSIISVYEPIGGMDNIYDYMEANSPFATNPKTERELYEVRMVNS